MSDFRHPWGWFLERRARQAAAIHRWKPWSGSTGPTSAAGKNISSGKALKPHSLNGQIAALNDELNKVNQLLKHIKTRRLRGGLF